MKLHSRKVSKKNKNSLESLAKQAREFLKRTEFSRTEETTFARRVHRYRCWQKECLIDKRYTNACKHEVNLLFKMKVNYEKVWGKKLNE